MLEVLKAPGYGRQGEAKMESNSAYQGCFVFIKGVDSDGTVVVSIPSSSAQSAVSYYPVKKLKFEEDLSDTSDAVDKFTWGDRCVYYEAGEFITNKFVRTSLAFGRALPTATAAARYAGAAGVDIVVTTVVPTTNAYVEYAAANQGWLTALGKGTAIGIVGIPGDTPAPKVRLIQVWGATAPSLYNEGVSSANSKARFQIIPGYVGLN